MVPGLHVAQVNGSTPAISSGGFHDEFANKLLILIDGHTVYSRPLSEVFSDVLEVPMEVINRIEDIRVTWNIGKKLSLSILGQNLLYDRHLESNATDQIVVSNLFKRSTFATFTLQF